VLTIIKNAVCTSSSKTCNLMLRAQMLSTALDVYFSTPSLGGNKVGSFNGLGGNTPGLGGVNVDLQHICAMVDGSSGASCTGITEDVRPEFGIASPCVGESVSDMLAYSNAASLVNGNPVATATSGATWYNQNKARQVPAKDAFDNINNQIAKIAASHVCTPSFYQLWPSLRSAASSSNRPALWSGLALKFTRREPKSHTRFTGCPTEVLLRAGLFLFPPTSISSRAKRSDVLACSARESCRFERARLPAVPKIV
jgi:hypothetical protein